MLDHSISNLATWQDGHYAHEYTESIYLLLHQLAGSSGTFDFNQLGQQTARAKNKTPLLVLGEELTLNAADEALYLRKHQVVIVLTAIFLRISK